jgi:hypothetical protein
LQPYELAFGFLNSTSLKWSYASMKGRAGDLFYRALAKESVNTQLEVIKRLGFAGIYIDKRGIEDNGNSVIDSLTHILGAVPALTRADGEIVFFRLPSEQTSVNFDGLSTEQIIQKSGYSPPPPIVNHHDVFAEKGRMLLRWIGLLWLGSLLFVFRHFIFSTTQNIGKVKRFGLVQKFVLILSTTLLLVSVALVTRSYREICPKCFDYWQRNSLGEIKATYHLVPAQESLVNGLENFPPPRPMAEIQLDFLPANTLKAISVSAIGNNGADLGNWTTLPVNYLWGIAIKNNLNSGTLLNYGSRKEELKLTVDRKLSLLISDNDNLPKCPGLYMQLIFIDGSRVSTLASCK